ncbi:PREDICTED: wall-associated [Prunus dulcis]|uniref:PREDICTED: wall-associated n=1 Tax=Prunus dulcis TaxID=3755 RepID=A0A5E4FLW0_PRUDU|nr:PREDICTED: wall-associated [Prunus dulcis]
MALHERMLVEQLSLVILMVGVYVMLGSVITTTVAQALPQALPGCPDKCGNLTIPYPFGIGVNCHMAGFPIICNTSTEPPTALWGNIIVTAFSLDEAEMQGLQYIARDCYDKQGNNTYNNDPWLRLPPPFTISDTKNKFIAVGCDTYALFKGFRGEERYITGCISSCDSLGSVDQDSCSGVGCCQTNIPSGMKNRTVELTSYNNHLDIWGFNPCSYAFIVEEGEFKFSNKTFQQLDSLENVPMIFNWAIGVEEDPCDEAQKRQDYILMNAACQILIPALMERAPIYLEVTLVYAPQGVIAAFFVLLVVFFCLYCGMKRRQFKKQQDKFFKQNGGLFLRQQLASYNGSVDAATIFTEEELRKATNNYNEERKIGEGGYGVVYNGNLSADHHNKVVAIKKSKVSAPITETQSLEFVNEVIVLSQIHHKNVVRLLGCCLETQTPILVYEYISHGTLHDHIHRKDNLNPSYVDFWSKPVLAPIRYLLMICLSNDEYDTHNNTEAGESKHILFLKPCWHVIILNSQSHPHLKLLDFLQQDFLTCKNIMKLSTTVSGNISLLSLHEINTS